MQPHAYAHAHTWLAIFCIPLTLVYKVYAITILKCFTVLKNVEFVYLFIISCVCLCVSTMSSA